MTSEEFKEVGRYLELDRPRFLQFIRFAVKRRAMTAHKALAILWNAGYRDKELRL